MDSVLRVVDFLEGLKDAEADREGTLFPSLLQAYDSFPDFVMFLNLQPRLQN
jgi:hypothetical protein